MLVGLDRLVSVPVEHVQEFPGEGRPIALQHACSEGPTRRELDRPRCRITRVRCDLVPLDVLARQEPGRAQAELAGALLQSVVGQARQAVRSRRHVDGGHVVRATVGRGDARALDRAIVRIRHPDAGGPLGRGHEAHELEVRQRSRRGQVPGRADQHLLRDEHAVAHEHVEAPVRGSAHRSDQARAGRDVVDLLGPGLDRGAGNRTGGDRVHHAAVATLPAGDLVGGRQRPNPLSFPETPDPEVALYKRKDEEQEGEHGRGA